MTRRWRWRLRLVPRSLMGQLMLAVAATLFIAQAVNFILLSRGQQAQYLAQASNSAATRITLVQDRLMRFGGEPARRVRILTLEDNGQPRRSIFTQPRRLAISKAPPRIPPGARPDDALADSVNRLLGDSGYAFAQVRAWQIRPAGGSRAGPVPAGPADPVERWRPATERGPAAIVAAFDGQQWISVRVRGRDDQRRLTFLLIGQTLLLYLVLLVPILAISWRASRPLGTLTEAVRAASLDDPQPPVTPQGPEDVRDLIAGFNSYQARIAAMLADKDRMLGAVGHDLRTPLASLRVRVEAVADPALRDAMAQSIDDMTVMLNDILALARGGVGSEAAELVDLATLGQSIAADYAERGLPVVWTGDKDGVLTHVRPLRLARAIRNLIDNGLAYGTRARLSVTRVGNQAVITISDDGPGLPPDRIAALTSAFARGETSRSRATGGAGLGLALAAMIAAGEQGSLLLANRADGSGLDAVINLPLAGLPRVI